MGKGVHTYEISKIKELLEDLPPGPTARLDLGPTDNLDTVPSLM
jgi:hypothetical protein